MTRKRVGMWLSQTTILAAGVFLAASPAQAWDDHSMPGAACLPFSEAYTTNLFHHWTGKLHNGNASGSLSVTCPVYRDTPSTTTGVWAAVYIYNPAGKTSSCTFNSGDVDGASLDSETKSTTTTGFQALYFTNVTVSATWTHYFITCSVPGGGAVNAYYVYEN
jgi:hypothetical protein